MLFFGTIDTLRSIVTPLIQSDLQLSYLELSSAFTLGSLGYLTGSFIGGYTVDRRGLKSCTLIGIILIAAGLLLYMSVKNYMLFVSGFMIAGFGGGIFEIGINGAVPAISRSVEDQARYFNWLHGFYGVGATGLPLASVWILEHSKDWRIGFWFELAILGIIFVFAACLPYGNLKSVKDKVRDTDPASLPKLTYSPLLMALLVSIMTYVMAEVAFTTWLPTYLVNVRSMSLSEGSFYLCGFYLIFTVGRITGHWWINRVGQMKAVVMSSCVALISLGVAVLGNHLTTIFFIVAGIGFSAIFPTIVAITCNIYQDHAGKVLGFLFTATGIGALLANWFVGLIANTYGLSQGFHLIFLFLICDLLGILYVIRLHRIMLRQQEEQPVQL